MNIKLSVILKQKASNIAHYENKCPLFIDNFSFNS